MDEVQQVRLPKERWEQLVWLGQQEQVPPDQLLEQAVTRFLDDKRESLLIRQALKESFDIWKNWLDPVADSALVVDEKRKD